jgi:myosin heavy subunit
MNSLVFIETPCAILNPEPLMHAAELLGTTPDLLEKEMLFKASYKGVAQRSPNQPTQAWNAKDTLAKTLYNNLFSWLVHQMNNIILPETDLQPNANLEQVRKKKF